jgi:hypothetical protein
MPKDTTQQAGRHFRLIAVLLMAMVALACGTASSTDAEEEPSDLSEVPELSEVFGRSVPCAEMCGRGQIGIAVVTYDGLEYQLVEEGDYVLVVSEDGSVMVQASLERREPHGPSEITSVAAILTDYPVEISADGTLKIDGRVEDLPSGLFIPLIDNAAIFRDGELYTLAWPGEGDRRFRLDIAVAQTDLNVTSYLPSHLAGLVAGLLGDGDGEDANDIALRSGTTIQSQSTPNGAPPEFIESWAVAPNESLFGCRPGEYSASNTTTGSVGC